MGDDANGAGVVSSPDEIRQIVREAVHETLTTIGINTQDPEALIETQKDQAWLRQARTNSTEFGKKAKLAAIGAGGTVAAWALWEGIKAAWRVKGGG